MSDLKVRKAEKGDFEKVMIFYRSMTDRMKESSGKKPLMTGKFS